MKKVNIQMPIKVKPYKHQQEAFHFVMTNFNSNNGQNGAALLVEMGLGKTLTSIAIAGALFKSGKIKKLLIVCPLSVVGVWQEEFEKFADFNYTLTILKGTTSKKIELLQAIKGVGLQVAVVNYESTWRIEKEFLKWNPELALADESHRIKTHNIAASKTMHRLGAKALYKLILTGTLITNKTIDAFSQYKFVNPSIFGNSFYAFRNRYFDMVGFGGYTPILKESMQDELIEKLHSIAFRATKAQCLDLPESIDVIRPIELESRAMDIYKSLVKDSFAELSRGEVTVTNILTKLLRLSQLTGGFLGNDGGNTLQQISTAKLEALEDIVEDTLENEKKLVVIARFTPEIKAICKMLSKKGLQYSIIAGDVKNRAEQIEKFQNNPDVKIFIGQIQVAGLGITLTAADTMVFYSLDYSMSNFQQSKARIHRVGQRNNCTYIYLIAKNTMDEKILKALQNKVDLAKLLIDSAEPAPVCASSDALKELFGINELGD